ncbi:MAG: TrmH family RNA methyltransferase [Cryomorphaceae bacterium]|nr:MAG: TrmH family RNA methyltransferase [Cryomorphaceae bacterium]
MNTKLSLEQLHRPNPEAFSKMEKLPLVVILENIRSRSNIGSVFRSADAFLVKEIFLCGYTACPPHRDIQKTALGATETVLWRHEEDTHHVIATLRRDGYQIWGVEQSSHSIELRGFNPLPNKPIALIFGNEVDGVQQSTIDLCDGCIEISQSGTKHSLNVAVCGGIVLYEIYRQWTRNP